MIYPRKALVVLSKMASTRLIHFTELSWRLIGGLGFIGGAQIFAQPSWARLLGNFLVGTSLILMALPHRWHAAYAIFWAQRISPLAVRLMKPISLIIGMWLLGHVVISNILDSSY